MAAKAPVSQAVERIQAAQKTHSQEGQQQAKRPGGDREDHRFSEELQRKPPRGCAERVSKSDFGRPAVGPRQHETRQVRAG